MLVTVATGTAYPHERGLCPPDNLTNQPSQ
jgi:hypothetical protein